MTEIAFDNRKNVKRGGGGIEASYRWRVASRLLAALVGGYLLANAFAVLLARLLHRFVMSRADGVLTAVMISFLVCVGAVLWAFAARSAVRAWLGLLVPAFACGVLAMLLGGGGLS